MCVDYKQRVTTLLTTSRHCTQRRGRRERKVEYAQGGTQSVGANGECGQQSAMCHPEYATGRPDHSPDSVRVRVHIRARILVQPAQCRTQRDYYWSLVSVVTGHSILLTQSAGNHTGPLSYIISALSHFNSPSLTAHSLIY